VVLLGRGTGDWALPAIHNAAFAAAGIDAEYSVREIGPNELVAAVIATRSSGYLGASVSTPHQRAVCGLVDRRSDEVERLGVANTLVHLGAQLIAYNAELAAVREELAELRPRPGAAVVLGVDEASLAVEAALADLGWRDLRIITQAQWDDLEEALRHADLVVNATPIGSRSDESPVPAGWLRPELAVLDLVYRPSPTRLVREARASGLPVRDGTGTLLRRAAASFTLWTGLPAPMAPMREALERTGSTGQADL